MKTKMSRNDMDHQYSQLKNDGMNLAAEVFKEECEFWRGYTPKRISSEKAKEE